MQCLQCRHQRGDQLLFAADNPGQHSFAVLGFHMECAAHNFFRLLAAEQQICGLKDERAGYYEKTDAISAELQKAYVVQNTAKMNLAQIQEKEDEIQSRIPQR